MAKPAMGARVMYCGHRGMFIADIWEIGDVNIVHASREVTADNLERTELNTATHYLTDFPIAGFWKPRIGVFVVPKEQVTEIKG